MGEVRWDRTAGSKGGRQLEKIDWKEASTKLKQAQE